MYIATALTVLLAIALVPQADAKVENTREQIDEAYNKHHNADGHPEMTREEATAALKDLGLREPTEKEFKAAESDRDNNETLDKNEFTKLVCYLEVHTSIQ